MRLFVGIAHNWDKELALNQAFVHASLPPILIYDSKLFLGQVLTVKQFHCCRVATLIINKNGHRLTVAISYHDRGIVAGPLVPADNGSHEITQQFNPRSPGCRLPS